MTVFKTAFLFIIPFLALILPAGIIAETKAGLEETQAIVIHFTESEQAGEPSPVTYTITGDYLRIDDTPHGKDYILLDRQQQAIYSVSADEQQIIKIKKVPVTIKKPFALNIQIKPVDTEKNAPQINGKNIQHHQYLVNDKHCMELVSVPGLLPEALSALKEFRIILAGQQAETLRSIPGDLHEACDLVINTFQPTLYLEKGFPILEKEADSIRIMINYNEQKKVSASLFALPDYRIVPIN
jgi:hypothetical protein